MFRISGSIKFLDPLRTPIPAVLVHLLLEWKTYLHVNSDVVNFVWNTDEGGVRGERALFC